MRSTRSTLSANLHGASDDGASSAKGGASERRIADVLLHPCVSDVHYLRQQHLLVLCRQGRTLLGGGAISLADMCGARPARFECEVTLRGRHTATLRGDGHALEWRPQSHRSRAGSIIAGASTLASRLRKNTTATLAIESGSHAQSALSLIHI